MYSSLQFCIATFTHSTFIVTFLLHFCAIFVNIMPTILCVYLSDRHTLGHSIPSVFYISLSYSTSLARACKNLPLLETYLVPSRGDPSSVFILRYVLYREEPRTRFMHSAGETNDSRQTHSYSIPTPVYAFRFTMDDSRYQSLLN